MGVLQGEEIGRSIVPGARDLEEPSPKGVKDSAGGIEIRDLREDYSIFFDNLSFLEDIRSR